jgi:predicted metalloprotease with PDZ domain
MRLSTRHLLNIAQLVVLAVFLAACGRPAPAVSASAAPEPQSTATQSPDLAPTIIADFPAPVLGVVVDSAGVVLHVEPNSMAARSQVQPGDVLLSINGLALGGNRQQLKDAIAQISSTSPLRMRINRNGNELEIAAVPPSPSPATQTIPARPPATATPVLPPNDYL